MLRPDDFVQRTLIMSRRSLHLAYLRAATEEEDDRQEEAGASCSAKQANENIGKEYMTNYETIRNIYWQRLSD